MELLPVMWVGFAVLNQLILARLAYLMVKENSHVRINGLIFLMVWGIMLGPAFTALCALIWILERIE